MLARVTLFLVCVPAVLGSCDSSKKATLTCGSDEFVHIMSPKGCGLAWRLPCKKCCTADSGSGLAMLDELGDGKVNRVRKIRQKALMPPGLIFGGILCLAFCWMLMQRRRTPGKKVGHGHSFNSVVKEAVKEAIAAAGVQRPTFAWIACEGADEAGLAESVVNTFIEALPRCKIHGCTNAGMLQPGCKKLSKGLAILAFDAPGAFLTAAAEDYGEAIRELKRLVGELDPPSAILMHTTPGQEERVLEALAAKFPAVPVYGGTAADANLTGSWFVLSHLTGAMPNGVSLVALHGGVQFGASMLAPYIPASSTSASSAAIITRAQGRTVYEINNQPALKWVSDYLGPSGAEAVRAGGLILPHTAHKPVSIKRGTEAQQDSPITAHCASISPAGNGSDGSVSFFVNVQERDTLIQMDSADGPATGFAAALVESYDMALHSSAMHAPDAGVLLFCGGMAVAADKNVGKGLLSDAFLTRVRDLPMLGITVFGEQSAAGQSCKSHHQNLCMGMLLFKMQGLPTSPLVSVPAALKVSLLAFLTEIFAILACGSGNLAYMQFIPEQGGGAIVFCAVGVVMARSLLTRDKQLDGYNQIPLHPVYPVTLCCVIFTVGFWLTAYSFLSVAWLHAVVAGVVGSASVLLVVFFFTMKALWEHEMLERVVRGEMNERLSASSKGLHQQRPPLKDNLVTKKLKKAAGLFSAVKHALARASPVKASSGQPEELRKARLAGLLMEHRSTIRQLALKSASGSVSHDARTAPRLETSELGNHLNALQVEEASTLVMSKLHVPLWDYLWVWLFVAPNATWLWATGVVTLLVRQWLEKRGLIKRTYFSAPQVAAQLVLEQMQIIYYVRTEHRFLSWRKDKAPIGVFVWEKFPALDENGQYKVYTEMRIELDLAGKRFYQGWLKHQSGELEPLSADQAVIMIWFDTISATHVKLHAYANWATNVSVPMKFAKRNSVITVMYNYFGYETFPRLARMWRDTGVAKKDFTRITDVFDHGVAHGVPKHPRLKEMTQHSQLANFVVKTRNNFLNLYSDYRAEFLAMDGEAMFIGTVLHSLDHSLMSWNLLDPLWLNVDDPKFGICAEIGRFVRVGFVDDLPFISFAKRYRDAPHPFYQAVYKQAKGINKRLADHMDTCIIK